MCDLSKSSMWNVIDKMGNDTPGAKSYLLQSRDLWWHGFYQVANSLSGYHERVHLWTASRYISKAFKGEVEQVCGPRIPEVTTGLSLDTHVSCVYSTSKS